MNIQSLIFSGEGYTHSNWDYPRINVGFSRLYYILGGEAYYEEEGRRIRLQPGFLYLTPVKHTFALSENHEDKLNHTYAHITTTPAVTELIALRVKEGSALYDAVMLWRRYANSMDTSLIFNILRLLISCLPPFEKQAQTVAERVHDYIEKRDAEPLSMTELAQTLGYSREHLSRTFFASYGMTPKQYSMQSRMEIAQRHLANGLRVYEVADILRFSSPYAFSKAFKLHFGVSPEQYATSRHRRT